MTIGADTILLAILNFCNNFSIIHVTLTKNLRIHNYGNTQ